MPELPEVETVRRGLIELTCGAQITNVQELSAGTFRLSPSLRTKYSLPSSPREGSEQSEQADVAIYKALKAITNAKIKYFRRFGKLLVIDLDNDYSLLIHLRMTGQLIYISDDDRLKWGAGHPSDSFLHKLPDNTTRAVLNLSANNGQPTNNSSIAQLSGSAKGFAQSAELPLAVASMTPSLLTDQVADTAGGTATPGSSNGKLYFNDQRKFGFIEICPTADVLNDSFIRKIGPEPNKEPDVFLKNARRHNKTTIKGTILNQEVTAGIGNIYADEALFMSKVHPAALVGKLTDEKLLEIYDNAAKVMQLSLDLGGSTMANYVDAQGHKGAYLDFAQVFRRNGMPCKVCGTIIEKTRVAGRGTHFCPHCQVL